MCSLELPWSEEVYLNSLKSVGIVRNYAEGKYTECCKNKLDINIT